MRAVGALALSGLVALIVGGCSSRTECGEGTQLEGDRCVALCPSGQLWDEESGDCRSVCSEGTIYNEDRGTCEPEVRCGPGTHRRGNECVPDSTVECGSGTRYDPETGQCVPDCVEGTHRDEGTGACMPDSAECITGQVWDSGAEACVDVAGYCGEGTTWVASRGTCVPDDDLLVADQVEGEGENDPNFGGEDAVESIEIPGVGLSLILGGSISEAEDRDGDGLLDPDYDYFVFTVEQPTLLRIVADGVGGASSGFFVTSMDEELVFRRYGIGTTSDGALRDVFLPRAGSYALVASDAMNFVTLPPGPFFGGGGLAYYITIERIALPMPEELDLSEDRISLEGRWPREAPETGSMLGFYSAAIEVPPDSAGTLLSLTLETEDRAVGPVLLLLDEEEGLLYQGAPPSTRWGFSRSGTLTLIADYVYWFGVSDAAHQLRVNDLQMRSIDGELPLTRVTQPSWYAGDEEQPHTYYGFQAEAGEVVTLHATTTTGVTRFEVYDAAFSASFGWFEGRDTSPLFENDIRFFAPRSGLYVLSVLGMAGAAWDEHDLSAIPAHRFNISAEIAEQEPVRIDLEGGEWATMAPVEVTPEQWERFFVLEVDAGDSLFFNTTSETEARPVTTFYNTAREGPLSATAFLGETFPRRFPDAGTVLFGLADATMSPARLDLHVRTLPVDNMGVVDVHTPIREMEFDLAPDQPSRFFRIQAAVSGIAEVVVTPARALDLMVFVREPRLELVEVFDTTLGGEPEEAVIVVSDAAPTFFEVATADSLPPEDEVIFEVSIDLTPFVTEREPNNAPSEAQLVPEGEVILGQLTSVADQDWYEIEVAGGATHLIAETRDVSTRVDTRLSIIGDDGRTLLAFDDDSGEGSLSRVGVDLPRSGTYYVVVQAGRGPLDGHYLLEVDRSVP